MSNDEIRRRIHHSPLADKLEAMASMIRSESVDRLQEQVGIRIIGEHRRMCTSERRFRRSVLTCAMKAYGFESNVLGLEADSDAALDVILDNLRPNAAHMVRVCNALAIRLARSEEFLLDDSENMWEYISGPMARFWMDAQIACEELLGFDVDKALEKVMGD